ncbi:MAG: FAD-dependent oxidoreductase [Pseudomonadota bacterium]
MGQGASVTSPSRGGRLTRRALLGAAALPLIGCGERAEVTGRFTGASPERGHVLRERRFDPPKGTPRKVDVVIAGGGVAGLAAARALRQRGIEDFALLEFEDAAGGNSRGGEIAGIACPLGAHYLPVPGDDARDVQELLEELGLRRRVAGRWTYDERHLCHAPQERLYIEGQWQEGLLPLKGVGAGALAQYRRFASKVDEAGRAARFTIPAPRIVPPSHRALDTLTFSQWLAREGFDDPHLRWYLDYCCRDDYGAGAQQVSAWAGIHYFASRHGFQAPGAETLEREPVLTWPEGNSWITTRLANDVGDRLRTGRVVLRVSEEREGVEIDAWNAATNTVERWQARHCIVALPAFIAARVVAQPSNALRDRAAGTRYAPWAVVNLHLREQLRDRGGAPPSWDNVLYGSQGLGYVDARHQSLDPRPGPTVLSFYRAPGQAARAALLSRGWASWRDEIVAEMAVPHPDLAEKLTRVEVARYGHAMATPVPHTLSLPASHVARTRRLTFAHGDWAGYSIFEEAFGLGHRAALDVR